jgi:hypothetical protein
MLDRFYTDFDYRLDTLSSQRLLSTQNAKHLYNS